MAWCTGVDAQIELLTRINANEFVESLGLGWMNWGRRIVTQLCRPLARHIAQDMARFDRIIARDGLRQGSSRILAELVGRTEVLGAQEVPKSGPLLIVANHPGLCDVLTIFATLKREDLLVVAADYPLLHALRGFNKHFIFVPRSPHLKRQSFNCIVSHLRAGGAVLILPAGEIEPDPTLSAEAVVALDRWSPSIGLIVHQVVGLSVVPAIISGVLLPKFRHHPLTWIRRRAPDRQHLGSMLQVLAGGSIFTTVRLSYGAAIRGEGLTAQRASARGVTALIVAQARALMQSAAQERPSSVENAMPVARHLSAADSPYSTRSAQE